MSAKFRLYFCVSAFCIFHSSFLLAQTPYYHLNRSFSAVQFDLQGIPTEYQLNEEADKLTDIVQGAIKTNNCYALERQTAVAIGYGSAMSAWNAAMNYTGSPSNYPGKIFDNAGWVRGTLNTVGGWGAYLWVLQNRIAFQSSTSAWWSTTNGVPVAISNVMVGSLGDYQAMSNVVDIGPVIPSNFPGINQNDSRAYQVDITNVFFELIIPDIWITPRDAFALLGSTNPVQYTVTGTNIAQGVTWSTIPDLSSSGGATIQSNGAWRAVIMPGNIATNYKIRATSVDNTNFYDEVNLAVVTVVIDNYAGITYDGLNSLPLVCRIEPEGITPSSYAWSATWPTPAYNDPQVTFQNPTGQVTRISNAHWYSATPSPGTSTTAFYNIYGTVQINGMSFYATPATCEVDVYGVGGKCYAPSHTRSVGYGYSSNGYFTVTSVDNWERIAPVIFNAYTLNSQFYSKAQAHEQKHKDDYDNGYDGHMFVQKAEFEPMVIGFTNSTLEGLDAMVGEELDWYLEEENGEMWGVGNEMEDRAYQVSDAEPPFYVYQRGGL